MEVLEYLFLRIMETGNSFDSVKWFLLEVQEACFLFWKGITNVLSRPFYLQETLEQLDHLGVGSMPVVLLTSLFTGAVLALQSSSLLSQYASTQAMGQLIAFIMIRELGPVLTALMCTGRVGAGIASELGGMVISQQIDALRALGTDYVRKLVTPRILACFIALPLLTAICDLVGIWSGQVFTTLLIHQSPHVFWHSVRVSIVLNDFYYSFFKSVVFGIIISMTASYEGLKTEGGTRGIGRSTTQAVMVASILIIASDFFLTKMINLILSYVATGH